MKVLLLVTTLMFHGGNGVPEVETVVLDSMQDCTTLMAEVHSRAHEYGLAIMTQCTYQSELEDSK